MPWTIAARVYWKKPFAVVLKVLLGVWTIAKNLLPVSASWLLLVVILLDAACHRPLRVLRGELCVWLWVKGPCNSGVHPSIFGITGNDQYRNPIVKNDQFMSWPLRHDEFTQYGGPCSNKRDAFVHGQSLQRLMTSPLGWQSIEQECGSGHRDKPLKAEHHVESNTCLEVLNVWGQHLTNLRCLHCRTTNISRTLGTLDAAFGFNYSLSLSALANGLLIAWNDVWMWWRLSVRWQFWSKSSKCDHVCNFTRIVVKLLLSWLFSLHPYMSAARNARLWHLKRCHQLVASTHGPWTSRLDFWKKWNLHWQLDPISDQMISPRSWLAALPSNRSRRGKEGWYDCHTFLTWKSLSLALICTYIRYIIIPHILAPNPRSTLGGMNWYSLVLSVLINNHE